MRIMKKILKTLGLVFLIFIGFIVYNLNKSNYSEKNQITLVSIKSNEKTVLTSKNDNTIYVFNFWASYCKPCIEELEYFNSLSNVANLKFYSINLFDDKNLTLKIMKKKSLIYDAYYSEDFEKSNTLPITLFLDKNLKVLYKQTGAFANEEEIFETIKKLR